MMLKTELIVSVIVCFVFFGLICFRVGVAVGEDQVAKKEKRCPHSCTSCKYWPCRYLMCEIEQKKEQDHV